MHYTKCFMSYLSQALIRVQGFSDIKMFIFLPSFLYKQINMKEKVIFCEIRVGKPYSNKSTYSLLYYFCFKRPAKCNIIIILILTVKISPISHIFADLLKDNFCNEIHTNIKIWFILPPGQNRA